jgi:hypothetical protein
MRAFAFVAFWLLPGVPGFAQTGAAPAAGTNGTVIDGVPVPADVASLYQAWKAESDAAKRADCAQQVIDAVVHALDDKLGVIADDVTRDGLPQRILTPPAGDKVALTPLATLDGAHVPPDEDPGTPVFRRIAADRFEAWTSTDGWLFTGRGRLVTHVKVPRRDGDGREWFGAFLPDGTWITTDLWAEDKQVNAFDAQAKWLWELPGADILKQAAHTFPNDPDGGAPAPKPIIDWARADRLGRGWVVNVGESMDTASALVAEGRTVAALPAGETEWDLVQPRSMGVRGFYTGLYIPSDDSALTLHRDEPGHGMYVGWPAYSVAPGSWRRVLRNGDWHFGFWPRSHAVFAETNDYASATRHAVWFFDATGKYTGEIAGAELGDSATGRGLLVTTPDDAVATVLAGASGPSIAQARAFTWADGSRAVPLAVYDDLHLGFFLRGPGIEGQTDAAHNARAKADIVVAKWRP